VPSAPLRVMYLTPYYRPYLGGIERAIEELSHQIQASPEVEAVGVLTTKYSFPRVAQPDWPDRETLPDGVEVFRLPGFPRWSPPLYSVPLVWFSPRRVRQYLDEFRPNVIHFVGDGWFWGHYWARFHWRGRARFVFTPSFHTLPLVRWWLAPINAALCRTVDDIVPLTEQESRGLRRAYLAPRHKLGIIGWGAPPPNPAVIESVRLELGAEVTGKEDIHPPGQPASRNGQAGRTVTILCVGRLGRHKGQLWLLDVYREARRSFNKPVRLVLVGRDEGDATAIADFIEEHRLGGEVVVTGEVSDEELARWYARANLFVLFSHYEAFGLVYFEAMAYGAPVLTHDVGSNRELLHRGAVVTPRFDRQAAAASLTELVNDDDARQQLATDASDYALAEFTWPAVAEKYLALYRRSR
jgi:glycosyltransferase involved in cell wall biosynthesis